MTNVFRMVRYLLCLIVLTVSTNDVQAQFFGEGSVYDRNRQNSNRSYNRYDLEEYLSTIQSGDTPNDSTAIDELLKFTTEDLRKLGVPENLIEELTRLNYTQDSIETVEQDFNRQLYEEKYGKEAADSFSMADVKRLIEIQKAELINKALALPDAYIYGHEFFRRSTLKLLFNEDKEWMPPPNYQLGLGDQMNVVFWGNISQNFQLTIDEKGAVELPDVGKIYLRGMEFEKAKSLIKQKYTGIYGLDKNNFDISVSMNYVRDVSANFVGELFNQGTYRFSAYTSPFNALVAIEGPNQIGSVRTIYIKRGNQTIKTLDLYDYLLNPTEHQNVFLKDNDFVIVPPMGNVVHLTGEVRRPHNYEFKDGESLADLVRFAGGFATAAYTQNIVIKRYSNNKEEILNVDFAQLETAQKRFELENGDSIFVMKVPMGFSKQVVIKGAVNVPGRYELQQGEKINTMLSKAQGLSPLADEERAYIIRYKDNFRRQLLAFKPSDAIDNPNATNNLTLQHLDTLEIVSLTDFRQDFNIEVFGAVGRPTEYLYAENMTLKDALYLAGGLRLEAANNRIEISRITTFTDANTGKTNTKRKIIQQTDIGYDLRLDPTAANFELQPYDHIFVRTDAAYDIQQTIQIYGEIVYPGEYPLVSKADRLTDFIERAGGLSPYAFVEGAKLYRRQDSTFVLLELGKAMSKTQKDKFNNLVLDGDSIFIPRQQNIVTLSGALHHFAIDTALQIAVSFDGERRANYYVNQYGGGFSAFAKRSRTYVQLPNGKTRKAKNFGLFNLYPTVPNGSTIMVDITKRRKRQLIREAKALEAEYDEDKKWNEAFDSITARIATVLTIVALASQFLGAS
ncbi:MAG: SLBB domain-containing protein [Chitinophagales bacterium]